jgi:hypothetical protein
MQTQPEKPGPSKFPLRLLPSVRHSAEEFASREGVSLNQFINVAIAEKVAHLRHEAWLRRRAKVTDASIARVLALLERGGNQPVEPGDELPEGYLPVRAGKASRKRTG